MKSPAAPRFPISSSFFLKSAETESGNHPYRFAPTGPEPGALWGIRVHHELSVLALLKGKEKFIFVYDDASRDQLIEDIRNRAADPAVNLSWFDAAVLTERARQQAAVEAFP